MEKQKAKGNEGPNISCGNRYAKRILLQMVIYKHEVYIRSSPWCDMKKLAEMRVGITS